MLRSVIECAQEEMRNSKLTKGEQQEIIFRFCQALTQIKKPEEAAAFITDLLSQSETEMLAKRLKIAEELLAGKGYGEIGEDLKVGPGTIARVNEWLKISGEGYRTIIKRLVKMPEIKTNKPRLSSMQRIYPQYYWPEILLQEIVATASKRKKQKLEKILSQLPVKSSLYKNLSKLLR